MTDNAQIRVRLITEDTAGAPRSGVARQQRRSLSERGEPMTVDKKKKSKKEKDRIKEAERLEKEDYLRWQKRQNRMSSMIRRVGGGAGPFGGVISRGAPLAARAMAPGGAGKRSIGARAGRLAMGAGAMVGAAKVFQEVIPLINAAVSEAMGVSEIGIFEAISEKINTVFSTVGAALGAVGPTLRFGRGAYLAGIEEPFAATMDYGERQIAINAEVSALQNSWRLDQNQVIVRQMVRNILGREGGTHR